jgi:uncharacterized protein YxjI
MCAAPARRRVCLPGELERAMAQYTIKKRLVSVGRDYDVRDQNDAVLFHIDGKVRFARTFDVKAPDGTLRLSVKEKLLALDQTFLIDAPDRPQTVVRRTTTTSVYPMKFVIEVAGQTEMHANGDFFRDGVVVTRGSAEVARVSREPNTVVAEIFHVSAADHEDPALIAALAMAIVESHPDRGAPSSSDGY